MTTIVGRTAVFSRAKTAYSYAAPVRRGIPPPTINKREHKTRFPYMRIRVSLSFFAPYAAQSDGKRTAAVHRPILE